LKPPKSPNEKLNLFGAQDFGAKENGFNINIINILLPFGEAGRS